MNFSKISPSIISIFLFSLIVPTICSADIKSDAYTFTKSVKIDKSITGQQKIKKINQYIVKLPDTKLSQLTLSLGAMQLIVQLDSSPRDGNKPVDPKEKLQKVIDSPVLKRRLQRNVVSFLFNTTRVKAKADKK